MVLTSRSSATDAGTDAPLLILHDRQGGAFAARLGGDLEGRVPIVTCDISIARPEALDEAIAGVRGLLVVHASGTSWSDTALTMINGFRRDGGGVVVARADFSRMPDELRGLGLPTLTLAAERMYPPASSDDRHGGGYLEIASIFAPDLPASPDPARPVIFISYAWEEARFVDADLVPALARAHIACFDYRYTERLRVDMLSAELERWVRACRAIVVVHTEGWEASEWCRHELEAARSTGVPVVVVRPPRTPRLLSWPRARSDRVVAVGRERTRGLERLVALLR